MKTLTNPSILSDALRLPQYQRLFPRQLDPYVLVMRASAGEYLLRQNEEANYLFLLIRGRCSISRLLSSGRNLILRTVYPFSLIGEMELLRPQPNAMSVKVLEESDLIAIPLPVCRSIVLSDIHFLKELCLLLETKEQEAVSRLIMAQGYPLENRLASFLLEQETEGWIPLTKVVIAESLGVSYRHLENVMNVFVQRGILEKHRTRYRIHDRGKLEELQVEPESKKSG